MRILVAEDEKALAKAITKIFESNHYTVDTVYNGEDALDYLEDGIYDAAVLDIMMPKMDGLTVLKKIRMKNSPLPVLLLTARSEVEDKVTGLDSGANYYLTKPFDSEELLAAMRAITRAPAAQSSVLKVGNISLDKTTFELKSPVKSFRLANKEFQMMEMFMSSPGILISSEKFMDKIWGYDSDADISVVWVYISYIRKKLQAMKADVKILSSRNAGYYLEVKK